MLALGLCDIADPAAHGMACESKPMLQQIHGARKNRDGLRHDSIAAVGTARANKSH